MSEHQGKCQCCYGTGRVLDAEGKLRPCSRCRTEEFNAWAAERYPKNAPTKPLADSGPAAEGRQA